MSLDGLLEEMQGSEVVIHTKNGYHYGRMRDYDGKMFYLERYYFNNKLIGKWDYSSASFFSKDGMVPAKDIISVSKIPSFVDDPEQDMKDILYVLRRRHAENEAKSGKQKKPALQNLLAYK